ncbi:hypothetical protein N8763_02090 [Gammaproteobacteria bacterium]|nr:hypothetical protein [Gammaproteobacteria bacterium]
MSGEKNVVVTSFSFEGYKEYGQKFLESFKRFNPDFELYLIIDDPKLKFLNSEYKVLENYFFNEIQNFLTIYNDRFSKTDFRFAPHRFIYKPTAIVTLNNFLSSEDADYITWIDGDTVFKQSGLKEALVKIKPKKHQIASVFERFQDLHYIESGLMIFNRNHSLCSSFINESKDIFISGRIFKFMEWQDALVWSYLMYALPPNSFRLLCKEFNIKGSHPISKFSLLKNKLDHLKGNNKKLGFSPEGNSILKNIQSYLVHKIQGPKK